MYYLFVEDSGSKDYINPYHKSLPTKPGRKYLLDNYFVLCGIRISSKDLSNIQTKINNAKIKYFGTKNVEIKSTKLRNPIKNEIHLQKKFNISAKDILLFTEEIYQVIKDNTDKIGIMSVVYDKQKFSDKKRVQTDGDPLLKSCQILFERVEYLGKSTSIYFDQMESQLSISKGRHGKIMNLYQTNQDMSHIYVDNYTKNKKYRI